MAYTVMSNVEEAASKKETGIKIIESDRDRLRKLAERWMEIASSQTMKKRKESWSRLHSLNPDRPMILFETFSVDGFLKESELICSNPILRNVERTMLFNIKQYDLLDDDIVFEEYYRIAWKVTRSDFGVTIEEHHAENSLAYLSNFPIKTVDDISKLKKRSFFVDRNESLILKNTLEEIFGDILPVVIGNYDNFFHDTGFTMFTGNNFIGLTMDLFKLIGNENLLFWVYDHPDAIHYIMKYLRDDRIRFYKWLEAEGLLDLNTDNQFGGPSSYGYTTDLPEYGSKKTVLMKDCWVWPESQETTTISPEMFNEFFLSYIADVANMFGLSYYGCCEPLDDRIDYVKKALPNLRTVSVTGWNDFEKIGNALGKNYVHCKKPNPTFISGKEVDWKGAKLDLERSVNACPDGNMEVVVRDVYDVNNDLNRIVEWVQLAKRVLGL